MTTRARKQTKQYDAHRRTLPSDFCAFCSIHEESEQVVYETDHFLVIKNLFPYTLWDEQRIIDHLMILPKKHTDTLSDLTPKEAQEYVSILSNYEKVGYNIWARAPQSTMKSVIHQHTHLIKSEQKKANFLFFLRKPYIRFYK